MLHKCVTVTTMAKKNHFMPDDCKELCNALISVSERYSICQIFEDWLRISAIAISNAVDWQFKDKRENMYFEIIKKYNKKELERMTDCFAILIHSFDKAFNTIGYTDLLGKVFHALNLHNEYQGQFFTPFHISEFMGKIVADGKGTDIAREIETKGYIYAYEPCIGSGAMMLALAKAMQEKNTNPQQCLVVTGCDIDIKCVCMSYIQLSLFGIPAVIVHGNSLTLEEWSSWKTPMYIAGFWEFKTNHIGSKYQTTELVNEN